MEETIKQNKTKSHKEFEKLLSEDLQNRKFKEGEVTSGIISEVGKKMNIQDLQDILAMISFELTIDANKSKYKIHENHKAQEKINTLIKLIDEKIN